MVWYDTSLLDEETASAAPLWLATSRTGLASPGWARRDGDEECSGGLRRSSRLAAVDFSCFSLLRVFSGDLSDLWMTVLFSTFFSALLSVTPLGSDLMPCRSDNTSRETCALMVEVEDGSEW